MDASLLETNSARASNCWRKNMKRFGVYEENPTFSSWRTASTFPVKFSPTNRRKQTRKLFSKSTGKPSTLDTTPKKATGRWATGTFIYLKAGNCVLYNPTLERTAISDRTLSRTWSVCKGRCLAFGICYFSVSTTFRSAILSGKIAPFQR